MKKLLVRLLSLALLATIPAVISSAPAHAAYSSCGNILGGSSATQSYADATNKITITPKHGSIFYIDSRRGLNASYVAYNIANTDSSSARSNLWVKLSAFSAESGNTVVSLANAADNSQQISSLSASSNTTVYFLLKASKSTTLDQIHSVEVFNGDPRLSSSSVITGCDYTFNRIDQTIAANANKVSSVTVSTTTPVLGGTLVVTVNGATGTVGAGDSTGDKDVMWISPASLASWPTRALRLESTQIQIKRNGKSVTSTVTNSLVITGVNARGNSGFSNKTLYTSTYTFRVIGGASTNPTINPVAQIASGTQMKHTGSYGTLPEINLTALSTPITVTKSAAAAAYTPTSCNGTSKIAVRYTITARVANGTAGTVTLDEIVDVPPASGSTFDSRSGQATYSDATPVTNASLGAPSTITGESPSKLHWTGPFIINGTTPATFNYTMCVDKVVGTYTNTAYGYVGNTIVGSNSLQVSCEEVTTNGSTYTVSITCNTTKPVQSQTIAFAPLDAVGVGSTIELTADSSSGLPVTFSSSTSASICTVALNQVTNRYEVSAIGAGTCSISADQSGNTLFSAAPQVSQNLTIKAGQYISVSSTSSMLISSTQNFTASSLKVSDNTSTGLTVTLSSLTPDLCSVAVVSAAPNFRVTSAATGVCTLLATQAGNSTYGVADDVYIDINIGSLQTINFTNPGSQTSTTSPSSPITISATSVVTGTSNPTNLQVSFASLTPDVCDISTSGGNYVNPTISSGVSSTTLVKSTAGVCTLVASQAGNGTYTPATDVQVSFTIGEAQVITFDKPTDARRSANSRTVTASTTASLLITFTSTTTGVCTVATGTRSGTTTTATVTFVSGGTCELTASQAGNGSWYEADSVTQTFAITGATSQTITFTQSDANINTSPISMTATASSALPVSYEVTTPTVCSVSEIFVTLKAVGNCTVVASQSGDVTYAAAESVTVTFVVFAKPTITFTQDEAVTLEFPTSINLASTTTYLAAAGATPTGLTVTYASTTTSICEITSGATLSLKKAGTCTVVASEIASNPNFLAADSVTVSFEVVLRPAITFGTVTSSLGGFTVNVTNYDAAYTYLVSSESGSAVAGAPTGANLPITVSGLTSNASSQLTVTKRKTGEIDRSADVTGTSLVSAITPNAGVTGRWIASSISEDGNSFLVVNQNGFIYRSTDNGINWGQIGSSKNWSSITQSDNGAVIFATVAGGRIMKSINSGATWSQVASTQNWRTIACNSDCSVVIAGVAKGKLWRSTNSGAAWSEVESSRNWRQVASSSSGTVLAAVAYSAKIYTSVNSGATWSESGSKGKWVSVAVNSEGNKVFAAQSGGTVVSGDPTIRTWTQPFTTKNNLSIAIDRNNDKLMQCGNDGEINVYSPKASLGVFTSPWTSCAISSDSAKLLATSTNGSIYVTTDSGTNWSSRSLENINKNHRSVVTSSDGTKVFTAIYGGNIEFSDDSGETWVVINNVVQNWIAIAGSTTLNKVYALGYQGFIYRSVGDKGGWEKVSLPKAPWVSLATSADGSTVVAVAKDGRVYNSTDSGISWTARDVKRKWTSVAATSDGAKFFATVENGSIFISNDFGVTWEQSTAPNQNWSAISSSSDGGVLAASVIEGKIYLSVDGGLNWSESAASRNWRNLSLSANGEKMIALVGTGQIYTSDDRGLTWTARESSRNWRAIALTPNGTIAYTSDFGKKLYRSNDAGVTWTVL